MGRRTGTMFIEGEGVDVGVRESSLSLMGVFRFIPRVVLFLSVSCFTRRA